MNYSAGDRAGLKVVTKVPENLYWQGKQEGNFQAVRTAAKADVEMNVEGKNGSYTATLTNKSETITINVRDEDCKGKPVIEFEGFNIK